jgi:hypothetical protein
MIERSYPYNAGHRAASPPPHAHTPPPYRDALAGQWQPGRVETEDPYEQPFEKGTEPPSTGPVPSNIDGGGSFDVDATFADNCSVDFGPVEDNIHT